jgi:hypothetical protein
VKFMPAGHNQKKLWANRLCREYGLCRGWYLYDDKCLCVLGVERR